MSMSWMRRSAPPRSTGIERALSAGTLITNIGATFPLAEIVAAHEAVEQGKVLGNVVVKIG